MKAKKIVDSVINRLEIMLDNKNDISVSDVEKYQGIVKDIYKEYLKILQG